MKIMQKIMSRGLIIIVAIAVVWAYINSDSLFPNNPEASTASAKIDFSETSDEVKSGERSSSQDVRQTDGVPIKELAGKETALVVDDEPAETPVPGWPEPVASEVQDQPVNPAMEQNSVDATASPPGATELVSKPQNRTSEAAQPAKASAQPEPVSSDVAAANESTESAPDNASENLIDTARQAFWQGDIDTSVQIYRQAMAAEPDNADIPGELGNILFADGDLNGAVIAYTESGRRLIKQHRYEEAVRVLDILRSLDPEAAQLFEETLQDGS